MWISRDRDNTLWIFNCKPNRYVSGGYWEPNEKDHHDCASIPKELFPEVTWCSEPLEVDLVPKNKSVQKDVKTDKQIIEDLFI